MLHHHLCGHVRISCILLWAAFCFLPSPLAGQELKLKVQHVSIEAGLSNRFVNTITQDEFGFIWIGTNFGLNRYDGHHFDIFTRENNGLQSNTIYGLYGDYRKNIWVIHREVKISSITGIDVIDPDNFEIKSIQEYLQSDLPCPVDEILNVAADENNTIYLITKSNQFFKFDPTGLNGFVPSETEHKNLLHNILRDGLLFYPKDYLRQEAQRYDGSYLAIYPLPPHYGKEPSTDRGDTVYVGETSTGMPVFQSMHYPASAIDFFSLKTDNAVAHKTSPSIIIPFKAVTFWDPYRKLVWSHTGTSFFTYNPLDGIITPVDYPVITVRIRIFRMGEFSECHIQTDMRIVQGIVLSTLFESYQQWQKWQGLILPYKI